VRRDELRSRPPGLLPARQFGTEVRAASGELGTVVALPVVASTRAHASAFAATLVERTDLGASLLQRRGAGQASDAGADQCQMESWIHGFPVNLPPTPPLFVRNRSHPLKKSRQPDDLYGIVAELADDLTDATRCT